MSESVEPSTTAIGSEEALASWSASTSRSDLAGILVLLALVSLPIAASVTLDTPWGYLLAVGQAGLFAYNRVSRPQVVVATLHPTVLTLRGTGWKRNVSYRDISVRRGAGPAGIESKPTFWELEWQGASSETSRALLIGARWRRFTLMCDTPEAAHEALAALRAAQASHGGPYRA
jgi:hypothetical protein